MNLLLKELEVSWIILNKLNLQEQSISEDSNGEINLRTQ